VVGRTHTVHHIVLNVEEFEESYIEGRGGEGRRCHFGHYLPIHQFEMSICLVVNLNDGHFPQLCIVLLHHCSFCCGNVFQLVHVFLAFIAQNPASAMCIKIYLAYLLTVLLLYSALCVIHRRRNKSLPLLHSKLS